MGDDWDSVTQKKTQFVRRKQVTVQLILNEFRNRRIKHGHRPKLESHFAVTLLEYFEHFTAERMLLYRYESRLFEELRASDVYGLEHFLRLLVKLPEWLSDSKLTTAQTRYLENLLGDLTR